MSELSDRVDRLAEEMQFSGVVAVSGGGEDFVRAYGLADRAHGIPMTPGTRLGIASGSKSFTALAVMSLVEDGTLALDRTARSLLADDLPLIADDVTVEHLLAHRSGIGDYLDEESGADISDYLLTVPAQRLVTTEDFLTVLDGYPTRFPAGERFAYCNGGFVVLALIAERASGVDYHDLVIERVCRPAGMVDTAFLRSDELPGDAALGYVRMGDVWRSNVFHLPVLATGDGGIHSTAADLGRFWAALTGGRMVSAATVARMLRPLSDVPALDRRYGLGFWLRRTGRTVLLDGYDAGVSFLSTHDPVLGTTATVVSNTSGGTSPIVRVIDEHLSWS